MGGKLKRGEIAWRVADYLAQIGHDEEITRYRIQKDTGLSYPTVYKIVPIMEDDGLVRSENIGFSSAGHIKKSYSLTLAGIVYYLGRLRWVETMEMLGKEEETLKKEEILKIGEEISEKVETLAENYGDMLPLIFGKWKHFKEKDVLFDQVMLRLLRISERLRRTKIPKRELTDDNLREWIRMAVIDPRVLNLSDIDREAWLEAVRSDTDLLSYSAGKNQEYRDSLERMENRIRQIGEAHEKGASRLPEPAEITSKRHAQQIATVAFVSGLPSFAGEFAPRSEVGVKEEEG